MEDFNGPHEPFEPVPPPSTPEEEERFTPLTFHGNGLDYFKIWIVNKALSVLTLGIYSAWAKVRTKRYFYGNTQVEGSAFEYLANPVAILKGRILATIFLVLTAVSVQFVPALAFVLFVVIFLITPWIIVKAARFNARVTAFRNVRFDFVGTMQRSYEVFLWFTFLIPFTLGLIVPYIQARSASFLYSGHRYGNQEFDDQLQNWDVYVIHIVSVAIQLLIGAMFFVIIIALMFMGNIDTTALESEDFSWWIMPLYGLGFIAGLFLQTFVYARMRNLLLSSASIGEHVRFRSRVETWPLFGIYMLYGALTLVTLGLAYPWLEVRKAAYLAECTTIVLRGSLDDVVDDAAPAGSATADQFGEALDLDLGFGF